MKQAMLDFGRKLREGVDASVFYYAGHGVQSHGVNYLIPVDAKIADEAELDLQAVDVNAFLEVMEGSSSKVNIVILDACRNNPFVTASRSGTRGLAMVSAPRGTYIAYSTAPGQVAQDGADGHSPYTEALAAAIQRPGLQLEDTFKVARRAVLKQTADKQIPWESSSIVGDFYFRPPAVGGDAAGNQIASVSPADTVDEGAETSFCKSGKLLFADDFNRPTKQWGKPSGDLDFKDGKLVIRAKPDYARWQESSAGTYHDVDVCVDVTTVASSDMEDCYFGVVFWYVDDKNFYAFQIGPDGTASVWRKKGGDWQEQIDWSDTPLVAKGGGETNTVGVAVRGGAVSFYINGGLFKTLTDTPPKGGRKVGVLAASPKKDRATFAFDNFQVSDPG